MAASDFTNVRVESIAYNLARIRYSYAGANTIALYRAIHGGSFSVVTTIYSDYGSYPTIDDTSVVAETNYDYKFSDDGGGTFSSVVSVQIQKQFPLTVTGSDHVTLPAFVSPEDVSTSNLQQMSDELQNILNGPAIAAPRSCEVCPVNGALTLDCTDGCYGFTVTAADITDINSIAINCESLSLNFDVPDGTTIEVCGFSEQSDFTGDECFQAPISSGVSSFVVVKKDKPPCANTRTRVPVHPCGGEYTLDCYDTGSLFWTGEQYNFSLPSCTLPVPGSGCCAGNFIHRPVAAGSMTVLSGDRRYEKRNGKPSPLAGFSFLFAKTGDGAASASAEFTFGSFTKKFAITGSPIFGVLTNVPEGSTAEDVTGLAMVCDYRGGNFIFGSYSHGNLRAGDLPTTIASATITGEPAMFFMGNYPDVSQGDFEIWDVNGNILFKHTDTGHAMLAANLIGYGPIWISNPDFGLHAVNMNLTSSGGFPYLDIES